MEDNFTADGGGRGLGGGGGGTVVQAVNASDGELQMKLRSLTHRSPPAVRPRSLTPRGLGTPAIKYPVYEVLSVLNKW